MRHLVLDTETTGLSATEGHRIIEIGAVEMVNLSVTGRSLHLYINPERDIDVGAQDIHGLSSEFLADKPVFADILTKFKDFIKDDLLVKQAQVLQAEAIRVRDDVLAMHLARGSLLTTDVVNKQFIELYKSKNYTVRIPPSFKRALFNSTLKAIAVE